MQAQPPISLISLNFPMCQVIAHIAVLDDNSASELDTFAPHAKSIYALEHASLSIIHNSKLTSYHSMRV